MSYEEKEIVHGENKPYPLAEWFTSLQGEGLFTGTPMTFIRLAGCPVGKPISKDRYPLGTGLHVWQEECTTYDGRKFLCDTDFRVKARMKPHEIDSLVETERVCITGGEPFIHNLVPLVGHLLRQGKKVHIETSGTRHYAETFGTSWKDWVFDNNIWIAVSPKKDYIGEVLEYCDEMKILVDDNFSVDTLPPEAANCSLVWLQPVNGTNDIDREHLDLCVELCLKHKNFRVSNQMHKIWRMK